MALIYVTGGAKSGKSKFAEDLLLSMNNGNQKNIYLATSIEKNNMLVDCLTNMVSNIIFENTEIDWDNPKKNQLEQCDKAVEKEVLELLKTAKNFENIVVVSNELGMGIVPAYPLGRYFREIAGKMNQMVAEKADEVYFVVSGISMKIK